MSRTIEEKIVELKFENKGFEQGIKNSQNSLTDLQGFLSKIGGATGLSDLGAAVDNLSGKFSGLGAIATGALLKIGGHVADIGANLVTAFGTNEIMNGFNEYELKINSIKTMLAGARDKNGVEVSLEMVNKQLEELNAYSDQTIYSFSNMTSNIGKFTNAGVDLETSVQSIKGISNAAALAGANSEEASRAMYNFAQALSSGYVKLIDWKSIENANMATVDFKTELLNAAVAAGKLEQRADGMYRVLGGENPEGQAWFKATTGFNDSLQEQWMTAEVLTKTLTKYSDATTELGAKATEAATKVRTFNQLLGTVKEALASGWSASAELIFGDFNAATELWSGINDVIGEMVLNSSDARNQVIKDWIALNGRADLINTLTMAWEGLVKVGKQVEGAFLEVFGPVTGITITKITDALGDLVIWLTLSEDNLLSLRRIFRGLYSTTSLLWSLIGSVFKGLYSGLQNILVIANYGKNGGILGFFGNLGDKLFNLKKAADASGTFLKISKYISDGMTIIANDIKTFIGAMQQSKVIKNIIDGLNAAFIDLRIHWTTLKIVLNQSDFLSKTYNNIKNFFGGMVLALNDSKFLLEASENIKTFLANTKKFDGSGLLVIKEKLTGFFDAVGEKLSPIWTELVKVFNNLKAALKSGWESNGLEGVFTVAKTFVTGAVGVAIIKFFGSLIEMIKGTADIKKAITGVFDGLKSVLEAYQNDLNSKALLTIATAIAVLVGSLFILTLLDQNKLISGVVVITAFFAALTEGMNTLRKTGNVTKAAGDLVIIAAAVMALSIALVLLSGNTTAGGVAALAAIMALLGGFMLVMSKNKGDKETAAVSLLGMAGSIKVIVKAIKTLSALEPKKMWNAVGAVAVILTILTGFSAAMAKLSKEQTGTSIAATGVALILLAVALEMIIKSIATLANYSSTEEGIENLKKGIIAMGFILLILAASLKTMADPKILAGAGAILIVAAALALLIPWIVYMGDLDWKIVLAGIGYLALILAVFGVAGAVLTPVIPTLLGLGVAILLIGAGFMAAGIGMVMFGAGLAAVAKAGAGAIIIMTAAVTAFVLMLPLIFTMLGAGLVAFAVAIGDGAPAIMEAGTKLFRAFLDSIVSMYGDITSVGFGLLLALLKGVEEHIGEIVDTFIEIVLDIIEAITNKLPEILEVGANFIIALIEGIGRENLRIIDAAFETIITFINGLADAIEENTPLLIEALVNLGSAAMKGIKDYFSLDKGKTLAQDLLDGIKEGLDIGVGWVLEQLENLGRILLGGLNKVLGIDSPSRYTRAMGENLDLGLIEGLKKRSGNVANAAKEVGENSLNALRSTVDRISDFVSSEIDSSPVITPVLDLNKVRSSASTLNGLLSTRYSYGLAMSKISDDKGSLQLNQNGSTSSAPDTRVIQNTFNLNGVTIRSEGDIDKLAQELYNKQENAMRSRGIKPSYVY